MFGTIGAAVTNFWALAQVGKSCTVIAVTQSVRLCLMEEHVR